MTAPTTEVQELHHGVVGNGRMLALVGPDTAVDWMCAPRFDSPSVFARLLDHERGGTFQFLDAAGDALRGDLRYLRNTNVLCNTLTVEGAVLDVVDFFPRVPTGLGVDAPLQLVRLVTPRTGSARLRVRFQPRPDYGRATPTILPSTHGVELAAGHTHLHLVSNVPTPHLLDGTPWRLVEPAFFVLHAGLHAPEVTLASVQHILDMTVQGWRAWARTCALPSFAPEKVLRSALCLKLHASEDTGAIIAAATTSVPEALGTPRTWDYRYCWLRDAAFVVEALRRLSHLQEGERFLGYLRSVAESGPLQPLYGIGGERNLTEYTLPHLRGFRGNGPVRVGNQAHEQPQNDLTGEVLMCLETLLLDPRLVHQNAEDVFPLVQRLVEDALERAPQPDTGIWEFRALLRPYTFSRAMAWAAADRGSRLAARFGHAALAARWAAAAESERQVVLERGFSARHGFFTQALDGQHPDAANLLLPMVGLLDARDPRAVATVHAYGQRLTRRGLMLRYRNEDDFGETTSAFLMCTFWWAEALAMMGELDEAVRVFDRAASHANALGLFSEDVDPDTGMQLGNFPQAYTHVGLINAATTLGGALEHRNGGTRPWK